MMLRELFGDGRPPTSMRPPLALDTRCVEPLGVGLLLRARASPATATTSRPTLSSAARRARRRSAAGRRRARGRRRRRARGDGAGRGALPRRPDGDAARRRRHRDERQDDDALLVRALLEAAGGRPGARDGESVVGGVERRRSRARRPRRSTCRRPSRAMLDAARRTCVDGGLVARARAAPRRRVHFAAAVFTNLTQDHLDFHATMEDYFAAKGRLFEAAPGGAIVNVDDPTARGWPRDLAGATSWIGFDARRRPARDRRRERPQRLDVHRRRPELRSPLPGRFNVLNVLGAVAAGGRSA